MFYFKICCGLNERIYIYFGVFWSIRWLVVFFFFVIGRVGVVGGVRVLVITIINCFVDIF